jgi:hypothetical protein
MSARQPRPPREQEVAERRIDGLRPLLQGHLRKHKHRAAEASAASKAGGLDQAEAPVEAEPPPPTTGPEAKGKRTRGKVDTATVPHLEGSEEGPK